MKIFYILSKKKPAFKKDRFFFDNVKGYFSNRSCPGGVFFRELHSHEGFFRQILHY